MPIYNYSELKGVIKVGDRVRAVPGKANLCNELKKDGSNECTITEVGDSYFRINGCSHYFSDADYYLEIIDDTPSWDTLKVGDVLVRNGQYSRTVLAVLGDVFLLSGTSPTRTGAWYTKLEAQECGYTLKGATDQPLEVTQAEVDAKFGRKVKIVE